MRAGSLVFGRIPGARPAVVGGLINGVAIGTPLLVGVASGEPAAGATACLGAYVAAFTNKGGGRRSRTIGLVVTALINTVAFAAGAATTQLFPLGRLPGRVARARSQTADYLDAALAHVAKPTGESRAVLDAARRTANSGVRDAAETLVYARREPVQAGIDSTATVVNYLLEIIDRSAALASLPDARSSPIPQLSEYRTHAVSAVRDSDAAEDVAVIETAIDGMRRYVQGLHQRREVEMRAQPDGDTPLRAAIRENEPVIVELIRIADTIGSLAHAAGIPR